MGRARQNQWRCADRRKTTFGILREVSCDHIYRRFLLWAHLERQGSLALKGLVVLKLEDGEFYILDRALEPLPAHAVEAMFRQDAMDGVVIEEVAIQVHGVFDHLDFIA